MDLRKRYEQTSGFFEEGRAVVLAAIEKIEGGGAIAPNSEMEEKLAAVAFRCEQHNATEYHRYANDASVALSLLARELQPVREDGYKIWK